MAELVAFAGLPVKETLCDSCPLRDRCAYMDQWDQFRELMPGLFVMSHDYAYLEGCPAPAPDIVIVDEAISGRFPARVSCLRQSWNIRVALFLLAHRSYGT